jgi:hypothetical protein
VTIDKFDSNPILVNINKLKPYRFVEETFQPFLVKSNDFLLKEPIETTHYGNLFIEELIETTHFSNEFTEESVDTNHYGNLFTEELVKLHIKGLIANILIEKKLKYSLSNQKLVEENTNDLL